MIKKIENNSREFLNTRLHIKIKILKINERNIYALTSRTSQFLLFWFGARCYRVRSRIKTDIFGDYSRRRVVGIVYTFRTVNVDVYNSL